MGAESGCVQAEGEVAVRHLAVVWADPGKMTGWCVVRVPVKTLLRLGQVGSTSQTWWRSGQYEAVSTSDAVDKYLGVARQVWERSEEDDAVVIGCEGFSLQMQSTDYWLLEPVRFLAVLQDRMLAAGVRVEVQMPGERTIITDARLQSWGLWKPGAVHARDAQRHCLRFLRRFCGDVELQKRYLA